MSRTAREHRRKPVDRKRLGLAAEHVDLNRCRRITGQLRVVYAALAVISAMLWIVAAPEEGATGGGHSLWLATRGAVVAALAATIVELARHPLAWAITAVTFQLVAVATDLATGISQPEQILLLTALLGLLPGVAIVSTRIRRAPELWRAVLRADAAAPRTGDSIEVPRVGALRTPAALAIVIRSAQTFYLLGSLSAGAALAVNIAVESTGTAPHHGLDVSVLSTWVGLFALAAWRLPGDPAGWSATAAVGASALAIARFAVAGLGAVGSLVLIPFILLFFVTLWGIAVALRSTSEIAARFPDHRFIRQLRGELEPPASGDINARVDDRRRVARRAGYRGMVFFAGTALVGFVALTALGRWVSPPPLEPAARQFVAEWNESPRAALDRWDEQPGHRYPLEVPTDLQDAKLTLPDPFVTESLQSPTVWLVRLMRNGSAQVRVAVRFPVAERSPDALVVYFRASPGRGWKVGDVHHSQLR